MAGKNGRSLIAYLILCSILLSGLYLRASHLSEPSFLADELSHVYGARSLLENGKPTLPWGKDYNRAILYTELVAISFKVFGINEFTSRLPSVFFGILTIILLFFVGRKFFNTTVGLIAAIFIAFIPFEIVWTRECRLYSMYQFFYLLGIFAFYNGFENEKAPHERRKWFDLAFHVDLGQAVSIRWLILALISFSVSFTLQPLSILFYGSMVCYLIVMSSYAYLTNGFREALKSKYFVALMVLLISGIAVMLVVDVFGLINKLRTPLPWAGESRLYFYRYLGFLNRHNFFPIGAFFLLGVVVIISRLHKAGIYTITCVGVPMSVHALFAPFGASRYIFDIFPLILLIASYFAYDFFKRCLATLSTSLSLINNKRIRGSENEAKVLLTAMIILLFLPASWWLRHSLLVTSHLMNPRSDEIGGVIHYDWRGASNYLKRVYRPGDTVITCTPTTMLYYFGAADYVLRKLTSDNYEQNKTIVSLAALQNVVAANARGWIVMSIGAWEDETVLPADIKSYITCHLRPHVRAKNDTVLIYSWNNNS